MKMADIWKDPGWLNAIREQLDSCRKEGNSYVNRTEEIIAILTDDFSFDENGIMKITREAVMQIVELLKEQQPKVVKLLDLYDSEGMQGYIETRKSIRPCFLVHHLQYPAWCYKSGTPEVYLHKMGIMDTSSLKRFWEFRLYNKTWRIWTARPTDEQRKAVPWETN